MLLHRIIPSLLLYDRGLVKTRRFKEPTYIGDPINAIRIFNEKEVDELIFFDIEASKEKRAPDLGLIENIASECFMPFCYGGGVNSLEQMREIYYLGVEKISLNTAAVKDPMLVRRAAERFGSQSVVVTMDVKQTKFRQYRVHVENGQRKTNFSPWEFAKVMEDHGAGELVVNSVDRDGMREGYDIDLMRKVRDAVKIPVVALGGCGQLGHLAEVIDQAGVSAAAAGSLFVYYGPLHAVLINYPPHEELRELLAPPSS